MNILKGKRSIMSLLLAFLTIGLSFGVEHTVNNIVYSIENNEAKVIAYNAGTATSVKIPPSVSYNGSNYAVKSLDDSAFCGQTTLNSICLSEGIRSIGQDCFRDCYNLAAVSLPQSITSISNGAFMSCHRLNSILIPDRVDTISDWTFAYCYQLDSIKMPQSLKIISAWSFYHCERIAKMIFPESLSQIGDKAFSYCKALSKVEMGDQFEKVGNSLFWGCGNLASISIKQTDPINLSWDAFLGVDIANCELSVPVESVYDYNAADFWGEFTHIIGRDFESSTSSPELNKIQIHHTANGIRIQCDKIGTKLHLYTIGGVLLESIVIQSQSTDLTITKGIYVLCVGDEGFTIVV